VWTDIFDFCGFSHVIWRISHAISHHTYPNTETDFEASTIEPFINFMTNKPRNSVLVFLYMHPFMALASTIDFFSRSVLIFRRRFPLTVNHFFPVIAWLPSVLINGFAKGTLLTLTMQVSLVFVPCISYTLSFLYRLASSRERPAICCLPSGFARLHPKIFLHFMI
jgi:fatty acid desaturase